MDVISDVLVAPFQYGFMVRALIVSLLVGVMCPMLGAYVVTKGLGFMGDALSHAVLPGMVAAFLIGVNPFLGAIPMGIAVALLSGYLIKRAGVSADTSVGLRVSLEDILLGQVLGVTTRDVVVTAVMAGAVLAVLYLLHKEFVFASFDPAGASVIGLPTQGLDYLLLALLAVVIVLAIQAVGIVLVLAMLITPAATSFLLVRNFPKAMFTGSFLGVISAVAGLYLSYHYNLPSGPSMALLATVIFAVVVAVKKAR
ncbi:MAG: metal ABC transporter permease [Chloroflexota bacterium]|nr:metal ABC transporter permease [Chloroflexota bacterium]